MRKLFRTTAAVTAVSLALFPAAALAASPEFAHTQEEWAKLQDNTLEYGELEDLIKEYNVTYRNNQGEYREFIREYGTTNEEWSDAYRELAADIYDQISGDDTASAMISDLNLEKQAEQMEKQADEAVDDSETYALKYEQAAKSLVATAQSRMMSYYGQKAAVELSETQNALNQSSLALTQAKVTAGMATQMDLLDAEASIRNNDKSLSSAKTSLEQTRQKLIVMLGWKAGDQPEIGALPQVTAEEISAIDLNAGKEAALANNYTLRINKKKLENSAQDSITDSLKNTIEDNEKQILLSVQSSYDSLMAAKLSSDQAAVANETAKSQLAIAAAKLQAGMITNLEYENQQYAAQSAQSAADSAAIDLLEAYETYQWNVNGLAAAE